ncbi:MAG: GGDEF domain-containing protein [Polyangiales bacterium]
MGWLAKETPIPGASARLARGPLDRLLLRLVPRELFENDLRSWSRVQLILRYTVMGAVFTTLFFPYSVFYLKIPYTAWTNGLYAISLFATPLVLRWTRSISVAAHWTITCAFAVLLFQSIALGGVSSLAFPWLAVLPVAGMLLAGTRGGLFWTAVCGTSVLGVAWMGTAGLLPSTTAPLMSRPESGAVTFGALAFALGAMGWLFETRSNLLLRHLERQRKTYHDRSVRDVLTGLANRALLSECIIQSWERCRRNGPRGALFFIDLNHFKQVNDKHGHLAGDQVLREVALRLKDALRRSDIAGRIGGDEFALVIEGIENRSDVAALADKVASALEAPIELDGFSIRISASIGIALYPDHRCELAGSSDAMNAESTGIRHKVTHDTVSKLLQQADTAMYSAKRQGRRYWIHGDRTSGEQRVLELA